jgi:hypothetical protein
MQISTSIAAGGYYGAGSQAAARPRPETADEAARRVAALPGREDAAAAQAVNATEPPPLVRAPMPVAKAAGLDEDLVRGRLAGAAEYSASGQRAIAQYTAVAAQPERSHFSEVLGVDTYA